jgi:hypothetical protein
MVWMEALKERRLDEIGTRLGGGYNTHTGLIPALIVVWTIWAGSLKFRRNYGNFRTLERNFCKNQIGI